MTLPTYATREDVQRAMDSKLTARDDARIDAALDAASRAVEGLLHRRFYPQQATRYFDWPTAQGGAPWRLWLDDSELISVTTLSSGGTTIPSTDYLLEPNRSGPPYNRIDIDVSTSSAFGGGSTWQRDITVTGLFGYSNDTTAAGTLTAAISSTSATTVAVSNAAAVGVGDLLQVDDERMVITGRTMASTSQTLQTALTASNANVTVDVTDGTAYTAGEVLLLDSERMLIVDIAGNALTVRRAWDGSVLATHTGSTVYASRTLTVTRGALGTTAATHTSTTTVLRHTPPGPVRTLTIAEALMTLQQQTTGYAKVRRTGEKETAVSGAGLVDLRAQVYASHGRKARLRGV